MPRLPPIPRSCAVSTCPSSSAHRPNLHGARAGGLPAAVPTSSTTSFMPRRADLQRILVIGSGPIVIGQAAEFDYSGTQATKALKEEGYEVILINSNPATIMTDPEFADRTYIEPVTPEYVELILEREKPDCILPTMGGQTALNVAMKLSESGALERHGVELIGATARAISLAEDRKLFGEAMKRIGLSCAAGAVVENFDQAEQLLDTIGFPAIVRPS